MTQDLGIPPEEPCFLLSILQPTTTPLPISRQPNISLAPDVSPTLGVLLLTLLAKLRKQHQYNSYLVSLCRPNSPCEHKS